MSDQSYITPTKERPEVPQTASEANFPIIQGDRYEFVEVIGSGGGGTVYKAHDNVLNKPVAIKKLHASSSDDMAIRFQREARLIAALNHPNVMSARDFGLTPKNEPYLILDYVDGESLSHVIRRQGALDIEVALSLFLQLCSGLAHAHKNGVIHRDIKPGNVMLVQEVAQSGEQETVAKVVDFGLAKEVEGNQFLTKTNVTLGTPVYMPPEQSLGMEVDRRSDIYSFGILMFEALSGKPPFVADSPIELAEMHLKLKPPTLESLGAECSSELDQIIAKCLQKNPKDRFQSFEALEARLQKEFDIIESQTAEKNVEHKVLDIQAPPPSTDRRTIVLLVLYFVLAAVVIGGSVWLWLSQTEGELNHQLSGRKELSEAINTEDKFLPAGNDNPKNTTNDGGYIFPDANDRDVQDLLASGKPLKCLDVSETQLSSRTFELLARRKSLYSLAYMVVPINAENMQKVASIKSLSDLRIGATKEIDFKALSYLNELPKLKGLEICDVDLTDEAFDQLSKFKRIAYLDLSNCRGITAARLKKVASLKNLEHLKIPYSDVTDDGIKAIKGMNIWALWIRDCHRLTDKSLLDIADLKMLRVIDVTGNKQLAPLALWRLKEKKPKLIIHSNNEPDKKGADFIFDDK